MICVVNSAFFFFFIIFWICNNFIDLREVYVDFFHLISLYRMDKITGRNPKLCYCHFTE